MKRMFISLVALVAFGAAKAQEYTPPPNIFEDGFKFCEGTVAYQGKILVSNFGSDELDPLNNEGKGYILAIENNKVKHFIEPDGYLCAPKGMWIHSRHLFVADVQKVLVYDLAKLNQKPVVIKFPEGCRFVNDINCVGDLLLVSVTDAGKLFAIDVTDMTKLATTPPRLLGDVPGANGIAVYDNLIFIASYNPTGVPNKENVIYIADITKPNAPLQKFIDNLPAGQYDGIALNSDGTKLFFTAWSTVEKKEAAIYVYDLKNKLSSKVVDFGVSYGGPADITIKNNVIWIPDLVNSRVYRFEIQNF